ncbi:MAG TPA: DUF2269 domain-containing protein [Gallionella sp.]|nr:DUF2269 domain-containing protein [Gallionella sp.]
MDTYLLVKWVHILSSVALVGVGFGSAFYLYFTNRTRNVAAIAEVSRLVVRADWWFTTPTVIIQPVSGLVLAYMAGYPLMDTWLLVTYVLFILAGAWWLPVVWLQIQMTKMARIAADNNTDLPQRYWSYAKRWEILGMLAFPAMLAAYGLMVFKPVL